MHCFGKVQAWAWMPDDMPLGGSDARWVACHHAALHWGSVTHGPKPPRPCPLDGSCNQLVGGRRQSTSRTLSVHAGNGHFTLVQEGSWFPANPGPGLFCRLHHQITSQGNTPFPKHKGQPKTPCKKATLKAAWSVCLLQVWRPWLPCHNV